MKKVFGWTPIWNYEQAIAQTVEWMYAYVQNNNLTVIMRGQIQEYSKGIKGNDYSG